MTKNKIEYSHIDYVLVRNERYFTNDDVCLYNFSDMKVAKRYAVKDIQNTLKSFGEVFSAQNNGPVSYSIYCGNPYWYYENDDLAISWEIRKIHNRTTDDYDDPDYATSWRKKTIDK